MGSCWNGLKNFCSSTQDDDANEARIFYEHRISWFEKTYSKMNEIFRENNEDILVPEWLDGFLEEIRKEKKNLINNGMKYQQESEKLLREEVHDYLNPSNRTE